MEALLAFDFIQRFFQWPCWFTLLRHPECRKLVGVIVTVSCLEVILVFCRNETKQMSEDSQESNGNKELGIFSSLSLHAVSLFICSGCLTVEPGPHCSDSGIIL